MTILLIALLTLVPAIPPSASAPSEVEDAVLVKGIATVSDRDEDVLGWRRVAPSRVPPGTETVPDARLQLLDVDPSGDGLYPDQWPLPLMGLPWAWRHSAGDGVVVAVVDSGIDTSHPDLVDRIFTNPGETPGNGVDDDGNGAVDDLHGWDVVEGDADPSDPTIPHGTQVASVALASADAAGMVGAAPRASLMPVRACREDCRLLDVAAAVVYATDTGADVINLSVGGTADPGPLADALDHAESNGVLVVAAAGNQGMDIDSGSFVPAGLPNENLLTVAATGRDDELWSGSNTGSSAVDLGSPGVEIVVATTEPAGGHTVATGTSFSAPHASAVAALVLSVAPHLEPAQIVEILGRHGDPSADLAPVTRFGTRLRADRSLAAARLTDIGSSLFDREIAWLAVAGITHGCNPPANTAYCPHDAVTRGEMAAFLTRALDLPSGPDAFDDDGTTIFHHDINALAAAGITHGCNPPANTAYCPHDPVTRGEMAAFLTRALDLPSGPDAFDDDDSAIFHHDIDALAAAGITHGCNPPANTAYCPHDPVTRGEMAAFLRRALG